MLLGERQHRTPLHPGADPGGLALRVHMQALQAGGIDQQRPVSRAAHAVPGGLHRHRHFVLPGQPDHAGHLLCVFRVDDRQRVLVDYQIPGHAGGVVAFIPRQDDPPWQQRGQLRPERA